MLITKATSIVELQMEQFVNGGIISSHNNKRGGGAEFDLLDV